MNKPENPDNYREHRKIALSQGECGFAQLFFAIMLLLLLCSLVRASRVVDDVHLS